MLKVFVEGKELAVSTVADASQILKFIMPNKKAYAVDNDKVVLVQNMTLEEANAIVNPQVDLLESIPATAKKTVVKAKVKVTPKKKTKKTVLKKKVKIKVKAKAKKVVKKNKAKVAKKKARR